jgi:membrane protease YdiL (CAAX protease family)
LTDDLASASQNAAQRPWSVWASLALYVVLFEVEWRVYDFVLTAMGLQAFLDRSYFLHSLSNVVGWGIDLLLIMFAVRLTRIPMRDYLGWTCPRVRDVALGIAVILALYAVLGTFLAVTGKAAASVDNYRSAVAAGVSPWWLVLQWWPTIILSPFVEETFFRGFLWRGVQYRYGNLVAFLVTTLLFAAMHYSYWMPYGGFEFASLVQYLVASSIFGALRWRSGGTIVPMIAHGLDNAGLSILQIVLSAIIP